MSEMIERIANAIERTRWEIAIRQVAGEKIDSVTGSRMSALAALEAMREPTEAAIEAGREEVFKDRMAGSGNRQTKAGVAVDVYRAMIDAALSPEPPKG